MDIDLLIQEYLADPAHFGARRKSQLSRAFLDGTSLNLLELLLTSSDMRVRRTGVFIASELGGKAAPLLAQAMHLTLDEDIMVRYQALEVVAVCAADGIGFLPVVRALESESAEIRSTAMRLLFFANSRMVNDARYALRLVNDLPSVCHRVGLQAILSADVIVADVVSAMLQSGEGIMRAYGGVVASLARRRHSDAFSSARASKDPAVVEFTSLVASYPEETSLIPGA